MIPSRYKKVATAQLTAALGLTVVCGQENAMQRAAGLVWVIVLSAMATGCGRSTLHELQMKEVTVGLLSVDGAPLTAERVHTSLTDFGFELGLLWTERCNESTCSWTARGFLPDHQISPLTGYRDPVLSVVYIKTADPVLPR